MSLKGKKVFVTGGCGFIGSHLTEELVSIGAEVTVLAQYNSSNSWGNIEDLDKNIIDSIEVISGNVEDSFCMQKAIKGKDVVFHLAALIGIPYSYNAPLNYLRTNVEGTLNVLEASLSAGVEKVVHTSTSETYGTAIYAPIDEKHPMQGQSPYSASKIGADKLAESYHLSFDLPVATIRPFNTFGPRQSARAVIITIITQALSGNVVRLGSLSPIRDMNYVKNTVGAFIKMAETPESTGEVVNIGSGVASSIGDIAKDIFEIIGKDIEIVVDKERIRPEKSEVFELLCDNTKAKELLGWKETVSFKQGITETIEWVRINLDRFKTDIYNV